ncbi:hypothetical protein [Nocardioides sp. GCM10030258]|uniref:hypothetical protein n=1 Tax=unclassified Nocardioides TaxID=2615069 RepID=UPI00360D358D
MKRAWLAGLLVVGALASGCGDDGDNNDSGDTGDNTSAVESNDVDPEGDEPAGLPKFCDLLTADQVSAAVGAAVNLSTGPFDACEFDQDDPRALSGSVGAVEVDTGNGGYDAYVSGAGGSLEDSAAHPLDGIGEQAFVTTGTFGGGSSLQAAGGALVGGSVYTVNLSQATGMSEAELVAISEKLLTLLVDAA